MDSSQSIPDDTVLLFCTIETAQLSGDHVEYGIKVQKKYSTEDGWIVYRRYSDFVALDTGLKPSGIELHLPPKKVFGNKSREFIAERQQKLQAYLDTVLSTAILAKTIHTKRFLVDDLYSQNFQELSLQHISMFFRSVPGWEVTEPLPGVGWRIRKCYFQAKNTSSHKEKYILTWCPFGPYALESKNESIALLKILSTLKHPNLYPIKLIEASEAGGIIIRPYAEKGSLKDQLCKAKPKESYLKKYGTPKSLAPLSIREIKLYGRQILELMNYMHEKKFPLGHVHSGNIFIQEGICKVTDIENFILGVPPNIRTQASLHRKINSSELMDSYGFGHLIYEWCFGKPMKHSSLDSVPNSCPPDLKNLLLMLLGTDSLKSGIQTIEDIILCPFFKDISLPQQSRPQVKIPSKLKETVREVKRLFETALQDEQRQIYQVKKQSKVKAHHMSDEERKKRQISRKKKSLREEEFDSLSENASTSSATVQPKVKSTTASTIVSSAAPQPAATSVATSGSSAPPPPPPPPSAGLSKAVSDPDTTRNALLGSIAAFSKSGLKKSITVDKSGPRI